ncbi:putative glycosyl hydrolase domain protein [anaerobic digester metagenome]
MINRINKKEYLILAALLILCFAVMSVGAVSADELNDTQNLTQNTTSNQTQAVNQSVTETKNLTVRGYWIRGDTALGMSAANWDALKNAGVTDVFVSSSRFSSSYYYTKVLGMVLPYAHARGIKVHAWVVCFKDASGGWVDPQGLKSSKVSVPYKKYWYKGWYKVAYKVKVKHYTKVKYKYRGKWRTKYKVTYTYVTKYKWKKGWTYKWLYQTKTVYSYDSSFTNGLVNYIAAVAKTGVDGVHLDYIRYPGTAYKYSGSTSAITSFVARVQNTVKAVNSNIKLSAAVMPEGSSNSYYYGQDYSQLSKYIDFIVPMIYKGNYGYSYANGVNKNGANGTAWIASKTAWIVQHSNGIPVLAGLQTYRSDANSSALVPANELKNDITAVENSGAFGYVLFRYGLSSLTALP